MSTKFTAQPAPKKNKGGRPPKLTYELIAKVATLVSTGSYLDTAARAVGVSRVAFHHWLKKAHEQERGIHRDFLNALEEAAARADVRDHAIMSKAAEKDWRAAEAHLKLRNPTRYNVKRQELSGPEGKPIGVNVSSSVEASLLALFDKLGGDDGEG